ncbi:DNA polymerase III subunit alpha [Bacillus sp. FJAT-42376]|uniref:DNA polymerase III subunit alpha n=1 Tax=Bacillus sp. FJAT-42376 TaxID=2014076 RepID=UPI000F51076E|nr:DNA polymerase III subunit alpha [Bacillus sp. FJAT-42376]AZB43915.1 DNA polymerase III subunit alpha [Bacillus sp. FJAT-42376]
MPFVHLQIQSSYSLLDSSVRLDRLVRKASELKFKSLALTDQGVMYGAVAFYKQCKSSGIKPIFGLTAVVFPHNETIPHGYPLLLLAETYTGYQNLLKISSALQTKSSDGIPDRWLNGYREGLIAISPGKGGWIETLLENGEEEEAELAARHYLDLFGRDSFYLGIQRTDLTDEEGELNKRIVETASKTGGSLAALNDVHYLEKDDYRAYQTLTAIRKGEKLEQESSGSSKERYFKSALEMAELFKDYPEALENTLLIAERCSVELELGKARLPSFPAPGGEQADLYLERLCLEGLKKRYSDPGENVYRRLTFELDVIKKMGFSDYFLIVWDFMRFAHERHIMTGPGRGSAAGSLVAYVLEITDVDPIKHRLLFERFLNPGRISMPDIDIDFPDTRRDEVIEYVAEKYGANRVAQIITFGTLAARASIRDTARVMGISPKEADQLAKKVPSGPGITLEKALKESPAFLKEVQNSPVAAQIVEIAGKIEGLPRHVSTHAAGVVFSEEPLTSVIPLREGHQDVYLTQYSMDHLEELGLLKMDFLGLRNLSLIESILKMVMAQKGAAPSFEEIGYDDQKTFQLLSEGDTTGVFQLESEGMRSVLRRLKPESLEDIAAVNALYRPGPMENIPNYIERKHGKAPIGYPHPDLKEILEPTYGIIVYQEQIMEIASVMAGFSLGDADLLRRAVGKKKKSVLDEERAHFVEGCKNKGYSSAAANEVYDLIVRFADYGFNRSHAVAYSMIGFQLAYLKAHYPAIFMTALLTSSIGNDDRIAQYVKEARNKGLVILPPSVNRSEVPFKLENGAIRYSLSSIKNVGIAAVKDIFRARKQKPFNDLFDFCMRVSAKTANRKTLEALVFAGAFDEFEIGRESILATLDVALEHAELMRPEISDGQMDLGFEDEFTLKPKYIIVEPFSIAEKLQFEKEALGFYFSDHPVSAYKNLLSSLHAVKLDQLDKKAGTYMKIGVYVSKVRSIRTKKGDLMAFLTISDETGDVECVCFPGQYAKISEWIQEGSLLLAEGKAERRDDTIQFILQKAEPLQKVKNNVPATLFLKIESSDRNPERMSQLKAILNRNKGHSPVYLYYPEDKKTIQLHDYKTASSSEQCIRELKDLLGADHVVLKKS